jgi:hypothetical protein
MASYPYMVQTAWYVLDHVFKEWQKQPYRWMRERDLQAEIGGRLNQIFFLQGFGSVEGEYKWAAPGFSTHQIWSRVSYEPYIYYEYEEGKSTYCYPDIVIWKDSDTKELPPEGQLWPILWACELKYGSPDDGSDDTKKLVRLIQQQKIDFGCSVRVHFVRNEEVGINWNHAESGRNLWVCDVTMPQEKEHIQQSSP